MTNLSQPLDDADRRELQEYRLAAGLTSTYPGAPTYPTPRHGWCCFHCGETFKVHGAAQLHFGRGITAAPGCTINLAHYREMERLLKRYQEEDSDLHRQLAREQSSHRAALLRAKDDAYGVALRDIQKMVREALERARVSTKVYTYFLKPGDIDLMLGG